MADDIDEVRKAETRRGKRPVDLETVRQRRRLASALRSILDYGTKDDLMSAMRELGLVEESSEWNEAIGIWNAERGRS